MARIRIGDDEIEMRVCVRGGLDSELACELLPGEGAREFVARAVPGAAAVVVIAGTEYWGRVRVTDPDDLVTVVEF